jgi:cryptochrome
MIQNSVSRGKSETVAIHWFRKGIRLHDSPALREACQSRTLYPVYILDPFFAKTNIIGINRYGFLLDSLHDLDSNLRKMGSRLYVIRGKPEDELPMIAQSWGVNLVTFESDVEPYAKIRDQKVTEILNRNGVTVQSFCSHTLHDPHAYKLRNNNEIPGSYGSFCKLFDRMLPELRSEVPDISTEDIPSIVNEDVYNDPQYNIPSLEEMGFIGKRSLKYPGKTDLARVNES